MQTQLFSEASGAVFSPCETFRYTLWRTWDANRPTCLFLMLNPSTADETVNDPTVERCQRYAIAWGYGGLVVCNIFAFRATDPVDMRAAADPIGPDNDAAILESARRCDLIVCAWGNHGSYLDRAKAVSGLLRAVGAELRVLKITGDGHPGHPLYLRKSLLPTLWDGDIP